MSGFSASHPLALKAKAMARGEGHELDHNIFVDCETAEELDPKLHAALHGREEGEVTGASPACCEAELHRCETTCVHRASPDSSAPTEDRRTAMLEYVAALRTDHDHGAHMGGPVTDCRLCQDIVDSLDARSGEVAK